MRERRAVPQKGLELLRGCTTSYCVPGEIVRSDGVKRAELRERSESGWPVEFHLMCREVVANPIGAFTRQGRSDDPVRTRREPLRDRTESDGGGDGEAIHRARHISWRVELHLGSSPTKRRYRLGASLGILRVPDSPPATPLDGVRRQESWVRGISRPIQAEARPKGCQPRGSKRFPKRSSTIPESDQPPATAPPSPPEESKDESLNRDRSSRRQFRAGSRSAAARRSALC